MSKAFSLIVTDTSPLLTLLLADALDVLLRPGASPGTTRRARGCVGNCSGGATAPSRSARAISSEAGTVSRREIAAKQTCRAGLQFHRIGNRSSLELST